MLLRRFSPLSRPALPTAGALCLSLLAVSSTAPAHPPAAPPSEASPGQAPPPRQAGQTETPDLLLTDGERLAATRRRVMAGDPALQSAMDELLDLADDALDQPLISVTDKEATPPSGDKNDYVSLAPYWWPNPDTEDGLPYVRRDGERNPQYKGYDTPRLQAFGNTVTWLGFAYYYTGEEKYADAAVKHLNHFLVEPETRMNPRMPYAQFVPGVADGRKYGIIETLRLRWVPDAVTLMKGSDALTPKVEADVKRWFGEYATWLNTSKMGLAERDGDNNHGTWAKVQIGLFSAFAGDTDTTRRMVELAREAVSEQIEPDGKQPEELDRTTALDYSEYNLQGYTYLAALGEDLGIDLWGYETDEGAGMRAAADFILPYIKGEKQWTYEQIKDPKEYRYARTLRRLALGFNDPAFEEPIDGLDTRDKTEVYLNLFLPLPEGFPSGE